MSGEQLQAGPTEPLSWGLSRDGVAAAEGAEAAGLVPCRPGGQYLEAPSSLTPSTLWHPPAFSVRVRLN